MSADAGRAGGDRPGPWTFRTCVTAACTRCGVIPLDEDTGLTPHFSNPLQAIDELTVGLALDRPLPEPLRRRADVPGLPGSQRQGTPAGRPRPGRLRRRVGLVGNIRPAAPAAR